MTVGATGPAGKPGATGHTGQRNAAPSPTDCDVNQPKGTATVHVAMCTKLYVINTGDGHSYCQKTASFV